MDGLTFTLDGRFAVVTVTNGQESFVDRVSILQSEKRSEFISNLTKRFTGLEDRRFEIEGDLDRIALETVKQIQKKTEASESESKGLDLVSPEPWDKPVDCGELLDAIAAVFNRYVVLPDHGAESLALWVLFSHAIGAFDIAPLLCLTSPVKRCGKGRTLDPLKLLVPRAITCASASAAAIYRAIEAWQPTLIIDEAEALFHGRGDPSSENLRGILDAGHTRTTARVLICGKHGDEIVPEYFSVFGAKAFALIGKLPSTLADRSIVIRLRRKGTGEKVAKFRGRNVVTELGDLCRKAARWALDNEPTLREAIPDMPELGNDRAIDSWEPLIAIADHAGGKWPTAARTAALALTTNDFDGDAIGEMLLADIRTLFESKATDRLSSAQICDGLIEFEARPWAEWRQGKPISVNALSKLLKPFDIASKTIRLAGDGTAKGYPLSAFSDAFGRYLPTTNIQSVTTSQSLINNENSDFQSVTKSLPIQPNVTLQPIEKQGELLKCYGVTFQNAQRGQGEKKILVLDRTKPASGDFEVL